MTTPAVRDPARLAAVRATGLLDTAAEEAFDRLTRLAVRLVGVPAAFVSLVDEHRDFYKSACGFGEPLASTRELTGPTFCHYTVAHATPLVIPDTAADPVYREVPTVRTLGVAAYVGVPLTVGGQAVGALCAIDVRPRAWTDGDIEVLTELAASAQREIELRGAVAAAALAREAAQAADQAKSLFLNSMSHELRTPLNAIGGYVQLLAMGVAGPINDVQRAYLSRIAGSGEHLLHLVNDVLDLGKLDAGQLAVARDVASASVAVEGAIALVLPQAEAKGVRIVDACATVPHASSLAAVTADDRGTGPSADPAGGRATYVGDEHRVRQVVVNLLSNAVKFTPTGGTVTVECDRTAEPPPDAEVAGAGRWTRLTVRDTGVGIDASRHRAVFEPFVQAETGPTRPQGGAGLGLTISRRLARLMGGDLTLDSAVGVGTTMTLWLPAPSEIQDGGATSSVVPSRA